MQSQGTKERRIRHVKTSQDVVKFHQIVFIDPNSGTLDVGTNVAEYHSLVVKRELEPRGRQEAERKCPKITKSKNDVM